MLSLAINYIAVLAASVVSMVIGGLWYSPVLFGKMWMKAVGMDEKNIDKSKAMKSMGLNFVALIVTCFVLANFVKLTNTTTLVSGALLGFWVWLGFVVTSVLPAYTYENRSMTAYALYMGYMLVALLVSGAILAL